jgi:hypothetical protein
MKAMTCRFEEVPTAIVLQGKKGRYQRKSMYIYWELTSHLPRLV